MFSSVLRYMTSRPKGMGQINANLNELIRSSVCMEEIQKNKQDTLKHYLDLSNTCARVVWLDFKTGPITYSLLVPTGYFAHNQCLCTWPWNLLYFSQKWKCWLGNEQTEFKALPTTPEKILEAEVLTRFRTGNHKTLAFKIRIWVNKSLSGKRWKHCNRLLLCKG